MDLCGCSWKLAMNLCPSGRHISHYCELWDKNMSYNTKEASLKEDFIDKNVRLLPVNYIAIVQHNSSYPDAVKIWRFKRPNISLLSRFQRGDGSAVTEGGDIYWEILSPDPEDDPIFTVDGDIVLNYRYLDNGIRLILSDAVNETASHDMLPGIGVHNHLCRNCDQIDKCNIKPLTHEMTVYGFNKKIETDKRYAIYVTSEVSFYFPMNTPLKMEIQLTYSGKTVYMSLKSYLVYLFSIFIHVFMVTTTRRM